MALRTRVGVRTVLSAALVSAAFVVVPASAHISLDQGGTQKSRYGDIPLKDGPCGQAGGKRGTNVYTYAPGETVKVTIKEFVEHPSYFRIAFDQDGDDDFEPPASITPVPGFNRQCPIPNTPDKCGKDDFYNSPAVLPGMDDLGPHGTSLPAAPANGANGVWTWDVKMPNVECTNCTLQVIQVMEDNAFHGPYVPAPNAAEGSSYVPDIYYQCIDLILKAGATTGSGGTPGTGAGGVPTTGNGGVPPTGNGGVPTTASGGSSGVPVGSGGFPTATGGFVGATGGFVGNGGAPAVSGGAPAANGGAFPTGTGAAPATEGDDDSGGCAVAPSHQRGGVDSGLLLLAGLGLTVRRVKRVRRRSLR
jgi:hypothetical protein